MIRCTTCNELMLRGKQFVIHRRKRCSQAGLGCSKCDFVGKDLYSISRHIKQTHDPGKVRQFVGRRIGGTIGQNNERPTERAAIPARKENREVRKVILPEEKPKEQEIIIESIEVSVHRNVRIFTGAVV